MQAKYDQIGEGYNRTRKADPYLLKQLVRHLRPDKNSLYLDIGCGTGNYTSALQQEGYAFIGIDPSERMISQAREKNSKIKWLLGTAENTGLQDQCVDGITGSLTIHHWYNLSTACVELHRILKNSGCMVIFTATPEQMKGYWLNHYFPKMLQNSIVQMPSLESVKKAMAQASLQIIKTTAYHVRPDLQDHFLYCGKQQPEMYFDEHIRRGISSFSALATLEEVTDGLQELKNDIDSGEIHRIIKSFENKLGDYLYIVAEKR